MSALVHRFDTLAEAEQYAVEVEMTTTKQRPLVLLITGSRDLGHYNHTLRTISDVLASERHPVIVIHGAARGVDRLAAGWLTDGDRGECQEHGVPALWTLQGRSAGPKRNALMLDLLLTYQRHGYDVKVLAFPRGESRGTRGMMRLVASHNIALRVTELPT